MLDLVELNDEDSIDVVNDGNRVDGLDVVTRWVVLWTDVLINSLVEMSLAVVVLSKGLLLDSVVNVVVVVGNVLYLVVV